VGLLFVSDCSLPPIRQRKRLLTAISPFAFVCALKSSFNFVSFYHSLRVSVLSSFCLLFVWQYYVCVCIYYCIAKFIFFRSFCFLPFREKATLSSVHISVLPTLNRFCIYRLTCMHWFESALASLHVRDSTAQCY